MNIKMFDVESYLEDRGVRVSHYGKNISSGWIGINCLWCEDPSNHLGINLYSKIFKCWLCGRKGPITLLIKRIENIPDYGVQEILEKFLDPFALSKGLKIRKTADKFEFPKEVNDDFTDVYYEYFTQRNFSLNHIKSKYQIKCGGTSGRFRYRIIIPIIMGGQIVGFTGRDISDVNPIKYKNCKIEESTVHPERWVYNIDTVREHAFILEGPFDVWRMGDQTTCLFGIEFSLGQINILLDKGVKKLFTLFDPEPKAQKRAKILAKELSLFVPTENIEMEGTRDPAEYDQEEVEIFKEEVLKSVP